MLRLSREERQLIPPHFHLIPNHFPDWCSHAQGTKHLKLSSSELQECSLAQQKRNSCELPSNVARLGTAVHLGIFLAWRVLDRRLQQVKEKNSLGMRCSGTHNNSDKPLETKSCGPNRSSSWYPTARLQIFDPLTIPPQGFGLPKTRLLEWIFQCIIVFFFLICCWISCPEKKPTPAFVGTFPQLRWRLT